MLLVKVASTVSPCSEIDESSTSIDDGGGIPVRDGRMRGIFSQSVSMVFYLGESGAGPIQTLRPAISAPPVILQSTHEAALDVVDLADLKHRALELS
jgi:hypothetical protein